MPPSGHRLQIAGIAITVAFAILGIVIMLILYFLRG
jgi:L-asparagine transporter-like permease